MIQKKVFDFICQCICETFELAHWLEIVNNVTSKCWFQKHQQQFHDPDCFMLLSFYLYSSIREESLPDKHFLLLQNRYHNPASYTFIIRNRYQSVFTTLCELWWAVIRRVWTTCSCLKCRPSSRVLSSVYLKNKNCKGWDQFVLPILLDSRFWYVSTSTSIFFRFRELNFH